VTKTIGIFAGAASAAPTAPTLPTITELCQRLEMGEPEPSAAALIRQQDPRN
jgi:hypothetical protein